MSLRVAISNIYKNWLSTEAEIKSKFNPNGIIIPAQNRYSVPFEESGKPSEMVGYIEDQKIKTDILHSAHYQVRNVFSQHS